ncbi:MAG: 2-succinyl-5-enolpyruvyl-6-hydroxy-3-cyclohexene-1-carboxylic-acid synthase [Candidatus Binatia bacterium]
MYEHDPRFAGLEAFVAELAHAGMAHACIMPGARSTPLAVIFATHPTLRSWSHVDERSGSFFALGIAKATRRPVAVVCTSGTAAANLLPAAVEAFYAHVPLLLLTADRPPELRDCGAGQTIDQIKLFGTHVKWFAEVGTAEAGLRYFRTLACRAMACACANPPGPVHLNFPFREPLLPRVVSVSHDAERLTSETSAPRPYTVVGDAIASPCEGAVQALAPTLAARPRGLIVCGPQDGTAEFAAAVSRLAQLVGYPILADAVSQLRTGTHDTSLVVDAYDAVLRDETFARSFSPDVVLRFGPMPTSKAFANYLQQHSRCRQIVIDPLSFWNDPTATASEILPWEPVAACNALCRCLSSNEIVSVRHPDEGWQTQWLAAARRVRVAVERQLGSFNELFEGKVFAELSRLLPDGTWLYVGNSMPIRDLESFWPTGPRAIRFLCNRGANGIDGFVSSGLGAAAASDRPVVIVTGDLGFYHDLNGLLAVKRHGVRATIVVINNDGGGIFSFLPQADCDDQVAEYFSTPHGLDFRSAAEMYGCAFTRVASWDQFRAVVASSLCAERTSVIEVPSDRRRNVELHRQIWAAASQALAEG